MSDLLNHTSDETGENEENQDSVNDELLILVTSNDLNKTPPMAVPYYESENEQELSYYRGNAIESDMTESVHSDFIRIGEETDTISVNSNTTEAPVLKTEITIPPALLAAIDQTVENVEDIKSLTNRISNLSDFQILSECLEMGVDYFRELMVDLLAVSRTPIPDEYFKDLIEIFWERLKSRTEQLNRNQGTTQTTEGQENVDIQNQTIPVNENIENTEVNATENTDQFCNERLFNEISRLSTNKRNATFFLLTTHESRVNFIRLLEQALNTSRSVFDSLLKEITIFATTDRQGDLYTEAMNFYNALLRQRMLYPAYIKKESWFNEILPYLSKVGNGVLVGFSRVIGRLPPPLLLDTVKYMSKYVKYIGVSEDVLLSKSGVLVNILSRGAIILPFIWEAGHAIYQLYRWCKGEITFKRCAKSCIDSALSTTAGIGAGVGAAAIVGGILGSFVGPVGTAIGVAIGGIAGSIIFSIGTKILISKITNYIFNLSPDQATDKAYEFMGVKPKDSINVIRMRYRELCLQYHPDKEGGDHEKFTFLQLYYNLIRFDKGEVPREPEVEPVKLIIESCT